MSLRANPSTMDAASPDSKVVPLVTSDAALLERLGRGEPDAAEELVLRYGGDMRRIAARILGPTSELVDVVHDSLARAFEKLDSVRDPSQLKSWLLGVTIRVAREHLRRVKRFPRIVAGELPERVVHPDPDARIELARVLGVLDTLEPDDRIAFSLRHIEGMELETVAEVTGVSLATAKRRIRRAADAFARAASSDPVLRPRLEGGAKWSPT